MNAFSVHGRTHRILDRLSEGRCGFVELFDACHAGVWTDNRRRKLHRLIDVLLKGQLIAKGQRDFWIKPAGAEELARLDALAGERVRVFARVVVA